MGIAVSRAEQKVDTRVSSSISLLASAGSIDSPAIRAMGIRGGGADTASGRAIPWGVSDPDGYWDRASDVLFRTPGM